jgi:hypothetical protein
MTKGLRGALLAPLVGAVLLLGAPSATFAAPDDSGRGAHSSQPGDSGDRTPKAGDNDPGKGPKAGDNKAGDNKAGDNKAGDNKPGDNNAGDKKDDAKQGDKYDRRYDRTDGHYDHDRYGYHGRHGWDTHRRYYHYGYRGPGWYDDCGYYGPDGAGSYYDSPDACDWQYGPQGESFRVNLSGNEVVPGPGAPNAVGVANLFIDLPNGVLCYRMGYDGINRPDMAHIHQGGPGQNGRPVIDLHVEQSGDEGCVGADPTALRNVRDHPEAFYLQLHTPDYPDGALRGQLFRTGS